MYGIKVKWPNGESFYNDGFTREGAEAMANFLWTANADDVQIICVCNECETCIDRNTDWG